MRHFTNVVLALVVATTCSCKSNSGPYRTALLGEMRQSFDPAAANDENEFTLLAQICGRLTSVDDSVNIVGDLADRWEISRDRKTYTFYLSKSRHFSDGEPVVAEDVKYSLERARTLRASMAASWIPEVSEVRVLGPHELQIVLAEGNPRFLYTLSHPGMCVLKRSKPLMEVDGFKFPNSAGPYRVSAAISGRVDLGVSEDFAHKAVEPRVQVNFLQQKAAVEAFGKGQLEDLSFYFLESDELQRLSSRARSLKTQIYWTWTLMLNTKREAFRARAARTNVIRGFDAQRFRIRWGADLIPSVSLVPHGMRGFRNSAPPRAFSRSFAPVCSRTLTVSVIDGIPMKENLKDALRSELMNASGCKVEVRFLEMGKWVEDFSSARSDVYFCGLDPNSLDPLGYYRFFISGGSDNYLGYDDRELTKQFQVLYQKLPVERSEEEYRSLQNSFDSAAFGIAIGSPNVTFLYARNVNQIHMNPIGMLMNRWWEIGRRKVSE